MKKLLPLFYFISALALVSLTGSCVSIGRPPIEWQTEELVGHELELVDDRSVESYQLQAYGQVMVAIGEKGGPVAGPMMYWRISNGRLIVSENEDGTKEFSRFTLLEKRKGEVVVRTKWGRKLVFKIL